MSQIILASSKLPLMIWFLTIHTLTPAKTNLAALEFKRDLAVRYRAAWRFKHEIKKVMSQREERRKLQGLVQSDDAYLGGE